MGLELQMDHVTAQRDEGRLPDDHIDDVRYADLVADPVGCVTALYRALGSSGVGALPGTVWTRTSRPDTHGRGAAHDYRFEDTGLDLAVHRALVRGYQERFGVALRGLTPLGPVRGPGHAHTIDRNDLAGADGAARRRGPSGRACTPPGDRRCRASCARPGRAAR